MIQQMPADPEAFLRLLTEGNPWWASGTVPKTLAPPYERSEFGLIRKELDTRPITALAGPRQVGKTTLLYQLIRHQISQGTPPKHLLYVSFDFPGLGAATDDPLNDALRTWGDRVLGQPWREIQGRALVCLDEITKAPNWHRDLKGWFDLAYPLKFAISDSSATALRAGAAASLTGRVSTHLLLPWKFLDVLSYRDSGWQWRSQADALRSAFLRAVKSGRAESLFRALQVFSANTAGRRSVLREALDRFLRVDGFPELLGAEDLMWCARRLREYVSLTLARDLYRLFEVRATGAMEALLALAARESGQRISYRGWADTIHLQERTLVDYLEYLEGAHLLSHAEFYSRSRAARIRKQRKVYVTNPGIRNALLGSPGLAPLPDPATLGQTVEGVVHDHARRMGGDGSGSLAEAFYWRDSHGNEVDVVVEVGGRLLPIEVKDRGDPGQGLEGIRSFLKEHRTPFGLVVTRDVLRLDGNLLYLPLETFAVLA